MPLETIAELEALLSAGKTIDVEFGKQIEDAEGYFEAGMRARLISVSDFDDGIVIFKADVTPFEAHNKGLESANYYDANGTPTLTASQAGHYPAEPERVYADRSRPATDLFTLLDPAQTALYAEFTATGAGGSYVAWLESELAKARRGGGS